MKTHIAAFDQVYGYEETSCDARPDIGVIGSLSPHSSHVRLAPNSQSRARWSRPAIAKNVISTGSNTQ
jgi:hypothetical protein